MYRSVYLFHKINTFRVYSPAKVCPWPKVVGFFFQIFFSLALCHTKKTKSTFVLFLFHHTTKIHQDTHKCYTLIPRTADSLQFDVECKASIQLITLEIWRSICYYFTMFKLQRLRDLVDVDMCFGVLIAKLRCCYCRFTPIVLESAGNLILGWLITLVSFVSCLVVYYWL